jgi:hypothetical protein
VNVPFPKNGVRRSKSGSGKNARIPGSSRATMFSIVP